VDLSEAILVGATLTGADLSTAHLTQQELERATGDENTRLPPDLKPPAHWGVKPDEQAKED
jgi:Pentapeptide repeats (8 copies)